MNKLKDLLFGVRLEAVQGDTDLPITSVAFDSRKVKEGGLFVAIKGEVVDGHDYIQKAISLGAIAIVCEKNPRMLRKMFCGLLRRIVERLWQSSLLISMIHLRQN